MSNMTVFVRALVRALVRARRRERADQHGAGNRSHPATRAGKRFHGLELAWLRRVQAMRAA